ncbi:non-ribosomal peptide synthetase [Brevibacillus borstelensis]|uniref:non-ribosomal peptide synthetase n=2 Tax=Brevibacillus borstelensis TaxID=45462 RepID=UPI00287FEE10|nr:non-ribosomal peptide synthetase [Brevibacillus borstelensis]WNF06405.1 amino acid adenylation domain-containing protein [Brevibacillus borstelensis]
MRDVSHRWEALSPEKKALLELLRKENRQSEHQNNVIQKRPNPNVYPLSYSQQRLWVMDQMEPGSPLYNIPSALRLTGTLDVTALENALTVMLERHEVLRATFTNVDGKPFQTIQPSVPFELPIIDLNYLPTEIREARMAELVREESLRPFDLSTGPLMRGLLIRMGEDDNVLLLTTHHIITDAWSRAVFTKELVALYNAFEKGLPSPLPPVQLQYADYAHWQQELMNAGLMNKHIDYWKNKLRGACPLLELPTTRPRPPVLSYRGARLNLVIPQDEMEGLKELSRTEGVTLFMALLAAFQAFLYRYTEQEDIVVGTPISNRSRRELEGIIGFFVNTLVMRTNFSGEPTFRCTLRQFKETALEAYEHQDLPFEKLVEVLQPQRSSSYHPLFQVFFDMDNVPTDPIRLQNLTIRSLDVERGTSKFDLSLYAAEREDGLHLTFEYSTDLFDSSTIERMSKSFRILVRSMSELPDQPISLLPLLSQEEVQELFAISQGERKEIPGELLIHQLFEAQVAKTPDRTAVEFEGHRLTYRELDEEANRLAHAIQKHGVTAGTMVGISVERSLELVIGILAIWKAGGVYIPLDPNYPKERLAMMIEETQPVLLLTQSQVRSKRPPFEGKILDLDAVPKFYANEKGIAPICHSRADHLAYITFTSGSTGRPKGVMASHQGPVNYLTFIKEAYQLKPEDVVLQLASFSFDASIRDLIGPLTAGACVVLPREEDIFDFERLLNLIEEKRVTRLLGIVPTLLNNLTLTALNLKWKYEGLRMILLSGEVLNRTVVEQAQAVFPSTTLVNQYGPTECTMTSSYYPVLAFPPRAATVPIGRPIHNVDFYILNSQMQPVPFGVPGELYIGGRGVSPGYFKQPELTKKKFVQNPFSAEGDRLYRTGDIVRLTRDGIFEYLGRMDNQIKLRGIRVELGEIESMLCQHEAVQNAVVVLSEGSFRESQLVAYYLINGSEVPSPAELRQYLKEKLPEYMLPGVYVRVERFPLTPNGKIDRKALPSPELGLQIAEREYVAPRTELEKKVADIWGQVLQLERVSMNDNFFELGGHSLLAAQLIARIRKEFRVDLPLRSLFDTVNVAGMAEMIMALQEEARKRKAFTTVLPTISPNLEKRTEPFPLTDIQQAYWVGRNGFYELGNVSTHSYLELETVNLDIDRLNSALNKLIHRHDMLRSVLTSDGQQRILDKVPEYRISVLDLQRLDSETAEERLNGIREELSHQMLPLDKWPLFDIRATKLDKRRTMLHISTDSFAADAWSRWILALELFRLYDDPDLELPPLELSFRDYVLAEHEIRRTEYYERAKGYWMERLADLPPAPDLPLAASPEDLKRPRFIRHSARLEKDAWRSLCVRAARAGVTPSGLIAAAFATVLGRWSKNQRFTINLTQFNRLPIHHQVNEIVGDFTSSILLAVNLHHTCFEERARAVQQQLFSDLDHSLFSGVQVLREINRLQGGVGTRAAMPIVLTSMLVDRRTSEEGAFPSLWKENMNAGVSQTPQVYLDHAVSEREGALIFRWDVVEELFPEGMIQDMFDAYYNLLVRLATDDDAWKRALPELLPEAQRRQHGEINATDGLVTDNLLHTLFAEQVAQRPDQRAVVSSDRTLTYGELFRRTNQLARKLRESGAVPNRLIAIVMEKGWEQVLAALGILQAGAAYLPIDPNLPQERLLYLLENGEVEIALTQTGWMDKIAWPSHVRVFTVEDADLQDYEDTPLDVVQGPDDLAYVIFTSGSTGQPKGVMIDHRGAVNTILDINERFGVKPEDKVFALSALNFDLSVYDLFGTLAAGGTIVFPEPEGLRDPSHWSEIMKREGVTIWNSVPALMEMLVDYADGQADLLPKGLRLVLLSGDWIPVSLPDRLRKLIPTVEIISLGGATEASIWSILYPIGEVDPEWTSIPYGKPMKNQRFYVLNELLEPCPTWGPGQLYIGGIGLAKGYWKDEAKTNASFIRHPVTGERLYKTGDIGRYLPDGNIEFWGREDFQVKIQGYRIELGEIEAALSQHDAVRNVVVKAIGEKHGNKRLVGYVVLNRPIADVTAELQGYLRDRLPSYMIPSLIMTIDAVPLSPNGKVNRKLLPEPQFQPGKDSETGPALTKTEEELTEVWKKMLNLDHVNADDNFFDLGGDSVIAIQLMSRINKRFSVEISPRRFFEEPTVASLARIIEEAKCVRGLKERPSLVKVPRGGKLPLSYAQQRLWYLCKADPSNSSYNIPVAIRLTGNLNLEIFHDCLNEIVRRHEVLRTGFESHLGEPQLVISPDLTLPMPIVDLSNELESKRLEVAMQLAEVEVRIPFQLEQPSLVRFKMFCLGEKDYIFVITMHHIISDAWSIEVFLNEMVELYKAAVAGQDPKLPELSVQYTDFAYWQREWLKGEVETEQLSYWKQHLAGPLTLLNLPISRPRTGSRKFKGARKSVRLSKECSSKLQEIGNRQGATLFMTMLAVFTTWLYRYTKQEDIVVSTSISNRQGGMTEQMIGLFLNTLALRSDLSGNPTFFELVRRVKKMALNAFANQDVPFERVVEQLVVDRQQLQSPLTQVVFGLRNKPHRSLDLPGLSMRQLDIYRGTAKFEMEMQLVNTEEGITGFLEYNAELFEDRTVEEMVVGFHRIAEGLANQPEANIQTVVNTLIEEEVVRKNMEYRQLDSEKRKRLLSMRPKKVQVVTADIRLPNKWEQNLPLIIKPDVQDLNEIKWLKTRQPEIEELLTKYGVVRLRGFTIRSMDDFQNLVQSLSTELLEYKERSTPRRQVSGHVYTSTEYPEDQHIPLHNENSYSSVWPMKIWFYCHTAAQVGGETPIGDSRKVYELIDPKIRETFERKQVMYVRNYGFGLDLPWQEAFQTNDRAEVEAYCRKQSIEFEWIDENRLRTRQVRPAVSVHPKTGEKLWFNQAHLFHVSNLQPEVRHSLAAMFKEEELPRNAYYGDGTRIEEDVLESIREAYRQVSISFPWQQGDIMLLDNMLMAHGRAPFRGIRNVLVSMSDPLSLSMS